MKKIFILLFALVVLLPVTTKAYTFNELSFKEALDMEEIDIDISSYKEEDSKADIYLFMGKGCTYCRAFLKFMANNVDTMGKYYNLHVYEVWKTADNKSLLEGVGYYLNRTSSGVPYIVIGNKVYNGYSKSREEEINNEIINLYNSSLRYDVFKMMKSDKGIDEYIRLALELKKNTVVTDSTKESKVLKGTLEEESKVDNSKKMITIVCVAFVIITLGVYIIIKKLLPIIRK